MKRRRTQRESSPTNERKVPDDDYARCRSRTHIPPSVPVDEVVCALALPQPRDVMSAGNASAKARAPASDMSLPGDRREAKFEEAMRLLGQYKLAVDSELSEAIAHRLNHPGHSAVDFDQPILSLGQLKDEIENAMGETVFEWINGAGDGSIPQIVLPQLFLEALRHVDARYQVIQSFLLPAGGKVNKTAMREHLCNNHEALFRLTPREERVDFIWGILDGVGERLSKLSFSNDDIKSLLDDERLHMVVMKYLEILVNVRLQDPPATFSNDCGGEAQEFDKNRHERPLAGESIQRGQLCTVAFPAMIVGKDRWTRSYTVAYKEPRGQRGMI